MEIVLKNGYVYSYAITGELYDGITVSEEDMETINLNFFESHYSAYKFVDGKLVFDEEKDKQIADENELNELRQRREKECFSVINRGQAWYNSLTSEQSEELQEWYQAWLNVTETREVPEKPSWI